MDFTIARYLCLVNTLSDQGISFLTFEEFVINPSEKGIVLRHDVDSLPLNSLLFARIQSERGIRATYYFRIVSESFNENIIKEIHSLGHEIGYHYEDFDLVIKKLRAQGSGLRSKEISERDLAEMAIGSFSKNLDRMRQLIPVKSICMHGSPLSSWDNRLLWKYYDYKEFGIESEPYFDLDFTNILYLTDTGRRWDGARVSVRDKGVVSSEQGEVNSKQEHYFKDWKVKPVRGSLMRMTAEGIEFQNRHKYRSTGNIVSAVKMKAFPERAMITFHPQRWTDKALPWVKELVGQRVKNGVKYFLLKVNSKS